MLLKSGKLILFGSILVLMIGGINFVQAASCDNYERDNGKIICVSEYTAIKLMERGWVLTSIEESIDWRNGVTTRVVDDYIIISSNGIPDTDFSDIPARNPHEIREQNFNFKFLLEPEYIGMEIPTQKGPIGITLSGVAFFDQYDRDGNDANRSERFDSCSGHVAPLGIYHTHKLSACFEDSLFGHSKIFGFVFDGFAVYGYNGVNGLPPTDLDNCNGHKHDDDGDYHYHATKTDPYLIGCFNGVL